MQTQADLLNKSVIRPKVLETTALGAAYLAGLAAGIWKSTDELREFWELDDTFVPQISEQVRARQIHLWHRAVEARAAGRRNKSIFPRLSNAHQRQERLPNISTTALFCNLHT